MHVRVTPYGHGNSYRSAKSPAPQAGYPPPALREGRLAEEMRNSAADPYPPAGGPARAPLAWGPPAGPADPGVVWARALAWAAAKLAEGRAADCSTSRGITQVIRRNAY
jgi:hypothetical protein